MNPKAAYGGFGLLVITFEMLKKSRQFISYFLCALVVFNILAWSVVYDLRQPQLLEVTFFDIGQGDAIFIETPQKHQILIDGGPSSKILEKIGEEMPFWDKSIDLLILTHPEHDHIAGLLEVLKQYKVENILWTGVQRQTAEYKEWQDLLAQERKQGANIFIARAGQRIKLPGPGPGILYLDILHPFEDLEGQEIKNVNNTSIVARLVFEENSFLFTGDAFKAIEKELVNRGADINSDVLKVSHHGSKTSSALEFIEVVSPTIAIIQCGRNNPYGHPHPLTLATLEKFDINVLRTDRDRNIKIVSDGKNYGISNFQNKN